MHSMAFPTFSDSGVQSNSKRTSNRVRNGHQIEFETGVRPDATPSSNFQFLWPPPPRRGPRLTYPVPGPCRGGGGRKNCRTQTNERRTNGEKVKSNTGNIQGSNYCPERELYMPCRGPRVFLIPPRFWKSDLSTFIVIPPCFDSR